MRLQRYPVRNRSAEEGLGIVGMMREAKEEGKLILGLLLYQPLLVLFVSRTSVGSICFARFRSS